VARFSVKEEIQETRLENGLVVLTDRMPGVRSATLGFFFRVGSRHEPAELNGISHFIEHTVFKGTKNRSALDIAIEQDRLGGNLDAFTTHEETGFAIKVIDDQLPRAFDLIADILANPRFDETDLKSEQQVIIEEMKMIEDSPEEYLGDIFSTAFFPGHPLGMSIAGTKETVRSFDSEVTSGYHQRVFNARNLVISAAGNVTHEQVLSLARDSFGSALEINGDRGTSEPALAAPFVIKNKRGLEQAHLTIATPFVSAVDERRYAADLLANIVGGGTSSRLWQKIREDRGLTYSVGSSSISYQDCGMFSIFAACSPSNVREVATVAVAEMRDIVENGVLPAELDLARQQSVASILLSLEDSASRAATLAQSEITHGRQISIEETLDKINSVTTENLASLAREYFTTSNLAFAALGDLKNIGLGPDDLTVR
jgi:predicted Zn-dependent peptidase